MNLTDAHREIMWNISTVWLMYTMFIVAMGIFGYGMWKRISFWRQGKSDGERWGDFGKRLVFMVKEILLQGKVRNESFAGWFHSLIFYSFIVLAITTGVVAVDFDLGTSFFNGYIYLFLSAGAELAGVLILIGVGMAVWRRYIKKPDTLSRNFADTFALTLVALLVITGFLAEGLRIASEGDPWVWISPVGYGLSFMFAGMSKSGMAITHKVLWWSHTVLAMGWIATMPFTKFFHILSLPANVFFAKMSPRGALKREDIEAMMEDPDFDEENFNVGIQRTSEFTWKQRLDFDSCIECGRCENICPANQADQPFGPKQLINNLRDLVHQAAGKKAAEGASVGAAAADVTPDVVGNAFDEEFIWYCRTCMACMEVCPAMIDHVDTLMEVRRNEVIMQGRMPGEAARAMRMLESLGNPFGPQDNRIDWIDDLKVRVVGPGEEVDVIYWIGCCTTFDPTKQKIAQDLCKLLDRCGIDFGVLGKDESCCGDPARAMGQEMVFQQIAKEQVEKLNSRKFRVLLTSCPHCYNVLANEYPQFGGNFNVIHHSEFIHEMLWSGTLQPLQGEQQTMVYHDPCYLGRYQKVFESPREVLKALPGVTLKEMKESRETSFCCGGGGGHYWMDIKKGERLNNIRVQHAVDAGADTMITGCAYCMQMLDDSVKILNIEDKLEIKDIATAVLESLDRSN